MEQNRRRILTGLGAAVATSLVPFKVQAAPEFRLKLSLNTPVSHPVTIRSREAADQIATQSKGRVQVDVFPSSQLGGDPDALSQLRSGALEMQVISGGVLANFIPGVNLYNTPFAFANYDNIWSAMDGDVGKHVGGLVGSAGLHAHPRIWDNGFRQITTSTVPIVKPEDLKNFKLRVAPAPLLVAVFQSLGTAVTSISVAETYSALQTRIVDGQENALALIDALKLYEVQKFCSLTNHIWDGFLLVINGRAWRRLPSDMQQVVTSAFDSAILKQRDDMRALESTLQSSLKSKGLSFNSPDIKLFKTALGASGFYQASKEKFGPNAWAILQKYAGALS